MHSNSETKCGKDSVNKNLQLAEKYLSVLQAHDLAKIFHGSSKYSSIFLPSVSDSYFNSSIHTMIVGKETRGWRNDTCRGKSNKKFELSDVLDAQKAHAEWLSKKNSQSKFFQFYRRASAVLNGEKADTGNSIVWSNLMCVSRNSKSPVRARDESFDEVNALSKSLLRAQIEVLQPKLILFVTGTSYDKFIREFFEERTRNPPIVKDCLWHFKIGDARCYRTSHPQWAKGDKYREQALSLAIAGV